MDTRRILLRLRPGQRILLRLALTAIAHLAALHLTADTLLAQRIRRAINFPVAINALPPGVTVRDRGERPRKAVGDERPVSFCGVVRDGEDRPVAKATVWLVSHHSEQRYQTAFDPPIETQTDTEGRFAFGEADEETFFSTGANWAVVRNTTIVARDGQGRIGWHEVNRRSRINRECDIHLREPIQLTGRVLDTQGKPLAEARLTPLEFLAHPPNNKVALTDNLYPFPALAAEFSTVTAADGSFQMRRVPRCDFVECRLDARGVEGAVVSLKAGEEATIRVGRPGKVAGSLAWPDDTPPDDAREAMIGLRLYISAERPTERLPWLPLQFHETTTVDQRGRFEFDGLPPGRYTIATTRRENAPYIALASKEIEVKEGEQVGGVSIRLTKLRQVTGRVVDRETGQGIPAVEMIGMTGSYSNTPPHLRLPAKTDTDGRFSFWLPPGRAHVVVDRVPPEYLPPSDSNGTKHDVPGGEWPHTELEPAATIEGRVIDEAGHPVPFARLGIEPADSRAQQRPMPYRCDRDGKFKALQLSGSLPVSLRARTSTAATPSALEVTPAVVDGPIELVISEQGACSISGQVVDQAGLPLPGATVSLSEHRNAPTLADGPSFANSSTSYLSLTADGRFETEALWPGVRYNLRIVATGYADYHGGAIVGEAGKEYDFGAIALEPLRLVPGEVVDEQGRPRPDAELRVELPAGSAGAQAEPLVMHTDQSGWFALTRVKNDGTLKIWARAGRATSDGAQSFVMREIEGRLRIVVAEANTCRVTGRVVDGQGRPLPTASVGVVWEYTPEVNTPRSGRGRYYARQRSDEILLPDNRPDEDGTFTAGMLWPGEHYHLRITADGHEKLELPAIVGERGTTAETGPIVLRHANRSLEGMVVDAAGEPLADATVINSGDGQAEKPLIVRTDAAGRFRLEGLFEGTVYILVRKEGYWPAGWRGPSGQAGQRITLTAADQPRPVSRSPEAGESPSPREREVARRLLIELWQRREKIAAGNAPAGLFAAAANPFVGRAVRQNAAPNKLVGGFAAAPNPRAGRGVPQNAAPNDPAIGELVALMATVDPDLASQWSASEGNRFEADVRRGLDRRDGIEVPAQDGPGLLVAIAKRRLAAGLRDEALRLLEDAVRVASLSEAAQPQSDLVWKAQIGTVAIAAGGEEWGRSLIDQAADRVEGLGSEVATPEARGEVAIALAPFDARRAIHVWELQPSPSPDDPFRARLAIALGHSDPRAAVRLASQQRTYNNLLIEIACQAAERDTDKAIEIIDNRIAELSQDLPWFRVMALGRFAVVIAPRDRSRAYDLIDRALGLCLPSDPPGLSRTWSDISESAARIAIVADEIGYPDMRTAVDLVLASRLSTGELPGWNQRTVSTARLLALVDPAVARELLGRASRPADPIDTRDGDIRLATWLETWALVDLERAEAMFREILIEQDPQLTSQCVQTSLLPMLRLLTTPRAKRGGRGGTP